MSVGAEAPTPAQPWHALEPGEVARLLRSDIERGLADAEAASRLSRNGPNALAETAGRRRWRLLADQFASAMAALLAAAAAISFAIGDWKDAAAVGGILLLNAALGYAQEGRAEKALASLKKLDAPGAKVRRAGRVLEVPARELVCGDIVLLEAGGRVPADCRLIECADLRVDESSLTGKSEPALKEPPSLAGGELSLGDRRDMAYAGTAMVAGRGTGIVVATGMSTQLGTVASLLGATPREPTPLQKQLGRLGRVLAAAAVIVVAVFAAAGLWRGEPPRLIFLTAVSMAVAAVPEGLPTVVAVSLALAAQRMLARKALIRKMPAVETLGSVTVICSDKTGTLTENRMTVKELNAGGKSLDLLAKPAPSAAENSSWALLLAAGALCNDSVLLPGGGPRTAGDPTEGALVAAAAYLGLAKPDLERILPRVAESPFDSVRKRMATVHRLANPPPAWLRSVIGSEASGIIMVKGALSSVLAVSSRVLEDGVELPLSDAWKKLIAEDGDAMARRGMRVLAAAFRSFRGGIPRERENDLVFLGTAGLLDLPRPEARGAVRTCLAAGIRPVMVTGDHPLTAQSVARLLDWPRHDRLITGRELSSMSDVELEAAAAETSIFARVDPAHKLMIVAALQRGGQVVAMTGDGINDAPALKKADIGIALGTGSADVAKDAAGMVLLDGNFATIVAAVEGGRAIFDNIRKFVRYLMGTNSGELWVMLLGPFLGMSLPLLPLQILWINLVTDGLPALALGFEPPSSDVMRRPARKPGSPIVDRPMLIHVLWAGLVMALLCLGAGYAWLRAGRRTWQTMILATLVFTQLSNALAERSDKESFFSLGFFSNPQLSAAVVLMFLAQLGILYVPALSRVFHAEALSPVELGLSLLAGSAIFWAVEAEKWASRQWSPGAR